MSLLKHIEKKLEEKKYLTEATQIDVTKEALTSLASAFDSLSDAFSMMSKKGNVDGGGVISDFLRKAELSIVKAKDRVKASAKFKGEEKFDGNQKKAIGEMATSLEGMSRKMKTVVDSFGVEAVEPVQPIEEPVIDELPPRQESISGRRKKRI